MRVSVEGGKYTYVNELGKAPCVLRYEEPWRDATGDKFIYCMATEIESLREQVEKLMKEGIEYREKWLSEQSRNLSEEAEFEILSQQVVALEYLSVVDTAAIENLHEQLATLAEQNAKMREALANLEEAARCVQAGEWDKQSINPERMAAKETLSIPDLATPVLNQIKAEAYREAALYCESRNSNREYPYACYDQGYDDAASDCSEAIRAKADELEKQS